MIKRVKALIHDQKGLTLVELLAVIVILGIIAAIAVPSIGKIIDNSKKDAHLANAQQVIAAAKLSDAANEKFGADGEITLAELINGGYIDADIKPSASASDVSGLKDPDGGVYSVGGVIVEETAGKKSYKVYLVGSKRSVGAKESPVPSSALDDRTKVISNVN
ncbi:type II secretion system protein [Peribacillus sp. JNUCC 23]|uniref:type II secretion system protein n=1 Tax=Peribacillus sp. NPDC096379 TaxID=3364393 RepID=UPI003821C410